METANNKIQCTCDKTFIYGCIAVVFVLTTTLTLGLVHVFNNDHIIFNKDASYIGKAVVFGIVDLGVTYIIMMIFTGAVFLLNEMLNDIIKIKEIFII